MKKNDELFKEIDLLDCPLCHGSGLLEEESKYCFYITCMDCGAHTAEVVFKSSNERLEAAKKAATQWNAGKVLSPNPGE